MAERQSAYMPGSVGLLALGLCIGLLLGVALAPRSGADVRRLVAHYMHGATSVFAPRTIGELAEDLSS